MSLLAKKKGVVLVSLLLLFLGTSLVAGEDLLSKSLEQPGRTKEDLARDVTSKPIEILTFFELKQGQVVTDLFSGEGYYSEILSHALGPKGVVNAHNNKAYVDFLKEKAKARYADNRLKNIQLLDSEIEDLKLKPNSQDMILMVLSYHDIYYVGPGWPKVDRDLLFKQVYAALKPGGILAIIDHVATDGTGTDSVQQLHRIDEAFAKKDIKAAGFQLVAESDLLRNPQDDKTKTVFEPGIRRKTDRFVLKFRKPS